MYIELRTSLLTVQLMICKCRSTSSQYVYCNNYIAPMCYLKMHFYNYKETICVMCWKFSISLSLSLSHMFILEVWTLFYIRTLRPFSGLWYLSRPRHLEQGICISNFIAKLSNLFSHWLKPIKFHSVGWTCNLILNEVALQKLKETQSKRNRNKIFFFCVEAVE